jgi:carbonic anhydrase
MQGDPMVTPDESFRRLRDGNSRFVSNLRSLEPFMSQTQREAMALADQRPHAIILGCSDSRVPAELVFDQGLGDLFVIRVAGNIVAPSQVGSVEFAAAQFGTRLVVVLGHSRCGAVQATLREVEQPGGSPSPNISFIVSRVRPAVAKVLAESGPDDPDLLGNAIRANVRVSADQLRHGSAVLEKLIRDDGLVVVGAEYSIETGKVDFFDGVPGAWL